MAYSVTCGVFELNSACNSYKKSGKIGEELNSWINPGSLCNSTSGAHMKIVSSAFENNSNIPAKYTCDGENINPPLSFLEVPENAKSLVLIVDDPDAPMGTFVHWAVYNIDPKITEVLENGIPKGGVEGMTSFGKQGYGGACPPARHRYAQALAGEPSGTHRYFFKLYALDVVLNLNNPDKETLKKSMQDHILEKAELIGFYSRI